MQYLRIVSLAALALLFVGCAGPQVQQCPSGTLNLPDCPPANAVNDERTNKIYNSRTWKPQHKLAIDPIKMGEEAKIPVNKARTKILGPTQDDALNSLTAKLWLIENAQHTVDVMYYIFKRDKVGYAMLGALCNAVKRGVDVRIMVDSLGSVHPSHSELRSLETCAEEAGFMRNAERQITTKKARVQVVIFNALSYFQLNRRSHDKLLVVDGHFPDKTAVMTGGRNISLDYYGIQADGSPDPAAFRDLEILIRASQSENIEDVTVGTVSEVYYTLLFLHKGNKRIWPFDYDEGDFPQNDPVPYELEKSQQSLAFLKSQPEIKKRMQAMPRYMKQDFHISDVRLAHQLGNLTSTEVTTKVRENLERNPNSILYLMRKSVEEAKKRGVTSGTLRIVSPYLFASKYYDEEGNVIYDGAQETLDYLRDHPDLRIEIVTNSVMTSDNIFTQAIIDMDMAPRMLLTPEMREAWQAGLEEGEFNPEVVESEEWKKLINPPQVFIYETGRLDSVLLGKGTAYYGKLHAKFIVGENIGFIGTSNFDYRSNLYNNEMGFFVKNPEIRQDLVEVFDWLKATSYRWGTPEWLQMRKQLMASDSKKASPARKQRGIYKTIKALGIEYLM